jgi:hypothetical protein
MPPDSKQIPRHLRSSVQRETPRAALCGLPRERSQRDRTGSAPYRTPPDLTTLNRRDGGKFPLVYVRTFSRKGPRCPRTLLRKCPCGVQSLKPIPAQTKRKSSPAFETSPCKSSPARKSKFGPPFLTERLPQLHRSPRIWCRAFCTLGIVRSTCQREANLTENWRATWGQHGWEAKRNGHPWHWIAP